MIIIVKFGLALWVVLEFRLPRSVEKIEKKKNLALTSLNLISLNITFNLLIFFISKQYYFNFF
jgi:hypothetical protein